MTATATNNGTAPRTRRQLTDSITKMDNMIDGLANAIPQTIEDVLEKSVGKAISEGIKAAVLEILNNPDLANVLQGVLPPGPPSSDQGYGGPVIFPFPRPSLLRRLMSFARGTVAGAVQWGRAQAATAVERAADTACRVVDKVRTIRQHLWLLRLAPKTLVLALVIGTLTATVAVFAPNWAIVTLSGLGGACLSIAAQAAMWVRGNFGRLALASD